MCAAEGRGRPRKAAEQQPDGDVVKFEKAKFGRKHILTNGNNALAWCYSPIRDVCAVPGKGSHNNTIRTLERSLLAADTDGYADTESGTSHECAVRVPKGLQRLEHYVLTHNLSQVDLSAALTGQQRFQGGERREGLQQAPGLEEEVLARRRDHGGPFPRSDCCCVSGAAVTLQS